jgi:hypothetical protein
MNVHELVLNYREFLVASWPTLNVVLSHLDWNDSPYFVDDWLQANWELLVEAQLEDVSLPAYGFDQSPEARYSKVGCTPTHRVICTFIHGEDMSIYSFLCFSGSDEKYKSRQAPPFDLVYVEGSSSHDRQLFPSKDVEFSVAPF